MDTIINFMEERKNLSADIKQEYAIIDEELKELLKDPKIKEYIEKKQKRIELQRKIHNQEYKFVEGFQKNCNHPMYVMIGDKVGYGPLYDKDAFCIVCGKQKIFEYPEDYKKYTWYETLFEQKKLIAYYQEILERTQVAAFTFLPGMTFDNNEMFEDFDYSPIEYMRNLYYQISLNNDNEQSVETILFNKMCAQNYEKYKSDKVLKKNS